MRLLLVHIFPGGRRRPRERSTLETTPQNKHDVVKHAGGTGLIQSRHHLVLGQGLEAGRFEIQALLEEPGLDVGGHELLVQLGCDGQFWKR